MRYFYDFIVVKRKETYTDAKGGVRIFSELKIMLRNLRENKKPRLSGAISFFNCKICCGAGG